jgi:hypothetical protein
VEPYAEDSLIVSSGYEDYPITTLANDPGDPTDDEYLYACRVWATLQVNATGFYNVGVQVNAGKTAYVASFACFPN